ncbi:MAG: sporulation protein YabP [Bacilli bacterium]|nr:sporulation protein YabP [Bacilli bacterium]
MDKEMMSSIAHSVTINERKNIVITGVKKIASFNSTEFLLDSNMGFITLKGTDLEIVKLDTFQGTVSIKGTINSFSYSERLKKEKEESVFNKLFK